MQRNSRTRSGCWTCRTRKKKCQGDAFPCQNCVRLGLECDRGTRIVWEDDVRRAGMRRRGPPIPAKTQSSSARIANSTCGKSISAADEIYAQDSSQLQQNESIIHDESSAISQHGFTIQSESFTSHPLLPANLTGNESILLDHYIQRFSRTYPTCSEPSNPFLSILLPLAMKSRVVLDALLALSGAQSWNERGWAMEEATLKSRHRALSGCRRLLTQSGLMASTKLRDTAQPLMSTTSEDDILFTLASCILMLLYEKLVGDGKANWMPHLQFSARLFDCVIHHGTDIMSNFTMRHWQQYPVFQFLHSLFLYNDLVQSTSGGGSTLSDYYLRFDRRSQLVNDVSLSGCDSSLLPTQPEARPQDCCLYYPHLIARISAGEETVTETDINAWDGRVDWLPSFFTTTIPRLAPIPITRMPLAVQSASEPFDHRTILSTASQEEGLISHLYRASASVYLIQATRRRLGQGADAKLELDAAVLACQAASLISQLREGSIFENALLWPISIVAKELTNDYVAQREYILHRLQALERRFHMKHFRRMQEVLKVEWIKRDRGYTDEKAGSEGDVFLFG